MGGFQSSLFGEEKHDACIAKCDAKKNAQEAKERAKLHAQQEKQQANQFVLVNKPDHRNSRPRMPFGTTPQRMSYGTTPYSQIPAGDPRLGGPTGSLGGGGRKKKVNRKMSKRRKSKKNNLKLLQIINLDEYLFRVLVYIFYYFSNIRMGVSL